MIAQAPQILGTILLMAGIFIPLHYQMWVSMNRRDKESREELSRKIKHESN